jgi:hypothetical protein
MLERRHEVLGRPRRCRPSNGCRRSPAPTGRGLKSVCPVERIEQPSAEPPDRLQVLTHDADTGLVHRWFQVGALDQTLLLNKR